MAGTGHRPPKLGLGYTVADANLLKNFAKQCLSKLSEKPTSIISGVAQGWDQALAEAALELGVPLIAAVAFQGMEGTWPADGRKRFFNILLKAYQVVNVCEGGYHPSKFIKRDHWMVDHADRVLALYDTQEKKSGTGQTVAYANRGGKEVVNVWGEWLAYRKSGV